MHRRKPSLRAGFRFLTSLIILLALALVLFAFPASIQAQASCAGTQDYGDAPASYGDACATLPGSGTLRIGPTGSTPDTESGSQYSAAANGDDILGSDDEPFLNPLTPIDLANNQYVWTIPVRNTTGTAATLAGWIDFNKNNVFESNERAVATVSVTGGNSNVTLTWTIPHTGTAVAYSSPLPITTYVRLRISPNSSVGQTGSYGNGEVEDYAVQLVESDVCAPGTSFYFIDRRNTSDHVIRTFDAVTGADPLLANPSQGQVNGIAVDRYRGFVYYQDAGSTDSDGLFRYDVPNNTFATVTDDAGASPLNLPLTNGWLGASGAFANGKYYAGVDGNSLGTIFEITFDSAGTTPVSSRQLFTPECGGGSNCANYGDLIVVGNRMYVSSVDMSLTNGTTHLDVYDINSQIRLSRNDYTTGANSTAIQLGRSGNGQIYAIQDLNGNVYTVNAANGTIENYPGGPVESIGYRITDASECPVVAMDFGDAPAYYGPNVGSLAARHALNANLRLGNATSGIRDLHGNASAQANGDDTTGSPADDEDAVPSVPSMSSSNTSYTLPNISVYNNTGVNATLYGWVDFNRNGVFEQNERVALTIPSSASQQTVSLNWSSIPGGHPTTGDSFIRLRLSTSTVTYDSSGGGGSDGAFLPTGYAPDGEIEDYPVTIGSPTAVVLSSFNADPQRWVLTALRGIGIGALGAVLFIAGLVLVRRRVIA